MTDERINAAIETVLHRNEHWIISRDYCTDLNAMHEAEKIIEHSDELFQKYYLALYDVTQSTRWPVCATARQRAEAFLRTMGKWEEAE